MFSLLLLKISSVIRYSGVVNHEKPQPPLSSSIKQRRNQLIKMKKRLAGCEHLSQSPHTHSHPYPLPPTAYSSHCQPHPCLFPLMPIPTHTHSHSRSSLGNQTSPTQLECVRSFNFCPTNRSSSTIRTTVSLCSDYDNFKSQKERAQQNSEIPSTFRGALALTACNAVKG